MSLQEQLEARLSASRQAIPTEKRAIMEQATNALIAEEISKTALHKGDTIPDFTLSNANGNQVTLSEVLSNKKAVVSFYRGGWCPYCNIELKALQNALPEIEANGGQLLAISPEQPDKSLTTKEKNELSFEVLSDTGNKVANDFGLVFKMPDSLQSLYHDFGLHVNEYNGNDDYELPMAATYVINENREIVYDFVNEDYTKRAEPSAIIEALKANN